ncbi:TM2 domain-containing protein [Ruminococcus sp.]|uniref:TM2 domain-containing protein n=1 Tax=Ruminococcus sp. TaxID=41978 RepID=UPI0025F5E056|nr:TM2 domain-containing protein [Ruminococcus sp.]
MAKILNITDTKILIGTNEGGLKEVSLSDVNYYPHVGDLVDIYETENRIIVTKAETPEISRPTPPSIINIAPYNSQNMSPPPQRSANSLKPVNKTAYCLLCIFLGGIGIHKFYAGKVGIGILYLLFCWTLIPSLIALIEFIIALCDNADANGNIFV